MNRKRDYTPITDAELDLHGYTAEEARSAVAEFMHDAVAKDYRRVRIVVGKGTHSPNNTAVLPDVVKAHLNSMSFLYEQAKLHEGGEGALVVVLCR